MSSVALINPPPKVPAKPAVPAAPTPEQIQFADLQHTLARQQSAQVVLTFTGICGLGLIAATAYLIWRKR